MEQFGSPIYFVVEKELDTACVDNMSRVSARSVNLVSENWKDSPSQTTVSVPSNGISKAGRAVNAFSDVKSNTTLWRV